MAFLTSVLVIDDDASIVEVICEYLEIKKIDVIGMGHNGKRAVELYKKLKPDVVLLDVMMPDYDGFYALKEIRKIDPDAKVIMVTADLTLDTEKRVKELKASAITYKPYEIDSLIEILDKVQRNDFAGVTYENKSMI